MTEYKIYHTSLLRVWEPLPPLTHPHRAQATTLRGSKKKRDGSQNDFVYNGNTFSSLLPHISKRKCRVKRKITRVETKEERKKRAHSKIPQQSLFKKRSFTAAVVTRDFFRQR